MVSKTAQACRPPPTGDSGSFSGIAFNMEMMQSLNSAMDEIQSLKEALDWERKLRTRAEKCRLQVGTPFATLSITIAASVTHSHPPFFSPLPPQACRLLATSKADSQKLEDRVSALSEEITQLNTERLSIVRGARLAAKRSTSYIMRFNELQEKTARLEQQIREKDKIIAHLNLRVQSLESERQGWCSQGR